MDEAGLADASITHEPAKDPFANINFPAHPAVKRVFGLTDDSPLIYKGRAIAIDQAVDQTYTYLESLERSDITGSFDRLIEGRPWFEAAL
jgi:hypothetical protein